VNASKNWKAKIIKCIKENFIGGFLFLSLSRKRAGVEEQLQAKR
jgi:hypothetical protein